MLNIFKVELIRSFKSKLFIVSLLLSCTIIIWYSIRTLPYSIETNNNFSADFVLNDFIITSYISWIGSYNLYLPQKLFYLLIPFIAVIPFGSSFYLDLNCGYIKNICVRTSKKKYLISKYCAVFISGGCATIIPMILSFMIACAFLPTFTPETAHGITNVWARDKWSDLYFLYPLLYNLLYLLMVFILSGLIACMSLTVSFFSFKSFLPLIFPFFVCIFSANIFELLDLNQYNILYLLTTSDPYGSTFSVIVLGIAFFIISFFTYYFIGARKDVI